jgi:putative lipase involved disintegration of autophagic bodies
MKIVRRLFFLIAVCALSCGSKKIPGDAGLLSFTLAASWTFPSVKEPALVLLTDASRGTLESLSEASIIARYRVTEVQQPIDPNEYDAARFISMAEQQSMRIGWETTEILAPDVSDRNTLLNLARASWDAYHPMPEASASWYPLEGFNWVC